MSEIERLRGELEAARADLFGALDGIAQDAFEWMPPSADDPRSTRDALWQLGLLEDWTRRAIDQGVHGRAVAPYLARERPAIAQTPEYLAEWLVQCRRPLLALLLRLPDDALDAAIELASGEEASPRRLLADLAARDREHARRIEGVRLASTARRESADLAD